MDLSTQVTISVPLLHIVLSIIIVLIFVSGLAYYIIRLNKKVNILTPNFGFGGKNLSTVAIVAFLAGVVPFLLMLSSNTTEIRRQAMAKKTIIFDSQVLNEDGEEFVVAFSVVPVDAGITWANDNYSAVWKVTGPTSFTFIEQNLNSQNPSYFSRILSPGDYEIDILVTGENFEVNEIKYLSL